MSRDRSDPLSVLDQAVARQAAIERSVKALSQARARLILGRDARSVFFACLALRLKYEPDESVEIMATDGRVLAFHPDVEKALSPDEILGVLAHEVLHCALAHPSRRSGRDPVKWNIACDLAINPLLTQAGFVLRSGRLMPGEGRFADLPTGLSAEAYYALLPDDPSGHGSDTALSRDPGGCGGVRDPGDGDPAETAATAAEWQVAVAQAEQAAQQRGELPGGLGRTIAEVVRPPADWRAVLREFVSATARNDYSWSRPNRRFLAQGLYLPGLRSEELGDVVLAVDTSGSVGERELGIFAREAEGILGAFDCIVTVIYHDATVQAVQTWQSSDGPLSLTPVGGGGTSHVCVFDWLAQSGLSPACVIGLTDLDTEFPATAPDVPVLWAVVGGNTDVPPFGRRVAIGD